MKSRFLLSFSLAALASIANGSSQALAAACCGGGLPTPSLISGDDRAVLGASLTYSEIKTDVYANGLWRKRSYRETSETVKIEGAHIFADRWQAGVSIPVIRRARTQDSSSGIGDVAASLGYEYLPDWDYNPWRPKGIGYLQLTIPSGTSIQEADAPFQLDSRGRGFWAVGLGTLLTKGFGNFDLFTSMEGHRSFQRTYSDFQGKRAVKPGYGGNLGFGAGYSLSAFRAGVSLTWTYEEGIDVVGATSSAGAAQRYATWIASLGYQITDDWSSFLSYSDQTLFGSPANSSLGRGVAFNLQKHWFR